MRILITNDDGIHAPRLAVLAAIARRLTDIRAVRNGFVSVRPLRLDRTDHALAAEMRDLFAGHAGGAA